MDAKDGVRFPGVHIGLGLVSQCELDGTLENYDFFEQYDETKSYPSEVFDKEGKQYQLGMIISSLGRYVVHCRVLTEDYQKTLAKHCQCPVCTCNWYSFFYWTSSICTVGCLYSQFPQQYYIKKAEASVDSVINRCIALVNL